ncbi:ATP-binding protein [Reinekea blandensis]|uniref:histidine kinase n=1 Tax=Reinekea blandensis MED297 TaxID=314283 RepID=A4BBP6_9GAMM|nr:ATP-binding protein [Reinekea blandensis]EAR10381.1 two component sensor kinase [Reinekea sp. MED297] [Reinekea blandensis MED297]
MTTADPNSSSTKSILRVRRHYNQWVADQTLEDFALRFTARAGRHMSISVVGRTALGATAFLALEGIAATVTLSYGFVNTTIAILVVALLFFITGLPISVYSARHGLDIDLLTRGAGFGYLGSTITSLIYATFTFIFFAIEASILSSALHLLFGIPLALAYVICAVVVIPIVLRGITAISKFQVGTQTTWLLLQIAALGVVVFFEWQQFQAWTGYAPGTLTGGNQFSWVYFGAAASIFFALIAQIGEQVDYLRFMPERTADNQGRWWFWVILSGPGWVLIGTVKMLLGSFLAYVAIQQGLNAIDAADPTLMYQRAFGYLVQSDRIALILAALMVIISQMKINVTNAYAGSIAWSNFFSRLTHTHPGRVVWLVFNVALALLLMELGIHRVLESILSVFAFVAVSWLCCLSADLLINKPLGLSPDVIEFKRGHLYDINPVGCVSMVVATLVGFCFYIGLFGEGVQTLGHFATIAVCFVMMPFMAWLTGGRYYLARQPEARHHTESVCAICQNHFESEDMLYCPAYHSSICSLCCSLDSRCMDQCKTQPSFSQQLLNRVPARLRSQVLGRSGQFVAWFLVVNLMLGALLVLVYRHIVLQAGTSVPLLASGLWSLFFILIIVTGVVIWLFLLAHESRMNAQRESNVQTKRLLQEIEAHQVTDAALQTAKELAENANAAKSRYLSGISHELRTPLQSILGYTQLLNDQPDTTPSSRTRLNAIHRSGQYLADLIEGLLDVSKIEAGKLDLHLTSVAFPELVQQIADMFRMQAKAKGIEFRTDIQGTLPAWVKTDEKRLRQILINLLSNAVKYTDDGYVRLTLRYRSQVAEFTVEDTGHGIAEDQHQRVFSPFERVENEASSRIPGTGLGLTIVKLLVEIMGGDIQLSSSIGQGSRFTVSLMLPWLDRVVDEPARQQQIRRYLGPRRIIMLVDDDAGVRAMVGDLLRSLDFHVIIARHAQQCLTMMADNSPDLIIMDIAMPGMDGLALTRQLISDGFRQPILMLSANAQAAPESQQREVGYSDYLVKPIDNDRLVDAIGVQLNLKWRRADTVAPVAQSDELSYRIRVPSCPELMELISAADIGFKRGILDSLDRLNQNGHLSESEFKFLVDQAHSMQFTQLKQSIEAT